MVGGQKLAVLRASCPRAVAAIAIALTLASCGPIQYLSKVSIEASREVAQAKTVGAEKHAVYEYWSAVTYLHMARQKAGTADYQLAIDYGERAHAMAKKAVTLSKERRQDGPRGPATKKSSPILPDADGRDEKQPPAVQVVPTKPASK
jgi:hypothetical protein